MKESAVIAARSGGSDDFQAPRECLGWRGRWIWSPKSRAEGLPFIHVRKVFTCATLPESCVIHLSAHFLFKLYVNGRFVGEGPPRDVAPRIAYCSFELRPVLVAGANVALVEAYSTAPDVFGAMIAQVEALGPDGDAKIIAVSDESWRVRPAPWQPTGVHRSRDLRYTGRAG
jgi:hypothetical protein